MKGTVKWFNDAKGFGMIDPDGGGPEIFVHFSAIVTEGFKTLTEGDRVEFDFEDGPKGPQAVNAKKVSGKDPISGAPVGEEIPGTVERCTHGPVVEGAVTNGGLLRMLQLSGVRQDDETVVIADDGRRFMIEEARLYPNGVIRLVLGEEVP